MDYSRHENLDYYQILNVPKNATLKDIREAYFRLKNTYTNNNQALYSLEFDDFLPDTINLIEQSYQTLVNDHERLRYDEQLVQKQASLLDELRKEHRFAIANKFLQNQKIYEAPIKKEPSAFFEESAKVVEVAKNSSSNRFSSATQNRLEKIIAASENKDGQLLRRLREELGIDKQLIQEHIKISISYIEHIEENRFSQLPQSIYVKGFIRSYLKFLGIRNQEHIVNAYIEKMEHS